MKVLCVTSCYSLLTTRCTMASLTSHSPSSSDFARSVQSCSFRCFLLTTHGLPKMPNIFIENPHAPHKARVVLLRKFFWQTGVHSLRRLLLETDLRTQRAPGVRLLWRRLAWGGRDVQERRDVRSGVTCSSGCEVGPRFQASPRSLW